MLVTARPLSIGTLLKDDDLREIEVAIEAMPDGAFIGGYESLAELCGALLRRYIDPNQPILRTDVLRPRDRGFLAAAQGVMGEAGGDLAALGETFRGGSRQVIEVTPNDRPG
jgi:Flp pilus assembly protein CpaB